MNIEKLEKEAVEFEENYTVYEVFKRKDGSDYTKKVCKVTAKEAYLSGAEPREKRIAELEAIARNTKAVDESFALQTIQLSKAKELLKKFIETSNPIYFEEDRQKVKVQAEQFLKDSQQEE